MSSFFLSLASTSREQSPANLHLSISFLVGWLAVSATKGPNNFYRESQSNYFFLQFMLCFRHKAELRHEGKIFLIHLFARAILLMKKLKIEETKATQYSTFKTDIIKVGLVFSISNFFINKIALANIWMSFSCSNLALVLECLFMNIQIFSFQKDFIPL